MPEIPAWWEFTLLALAAWRVYRLLAEDTILDWPRRKLVRLDPTWQEEGDYPGENYRQGVAAFVICPYCLGFWSAVGWWAAWTQWPHTTLVVATPFAISALVALISKLDERLNS